MKYQITDGTVSLGGETVLSHIDFEIDFVRLWGIF